MTPSLVSLIIPVYNGSNYLREAIESALAQTYPCCEVIVINDGSTDQGATEAIALSYGERIRYFSKANGGVASALNLGLREMRGSFFSWLSHDDVYLPEKVATQLAFWQKIGDPQAIIVSDADILTAEGLRSPGVSFSFLPGDDFWIQAYGRSFVNGCAMLIPRELMGQGLREDLATTQDYDFWLTLGEQVHFIHQPEVVMLSRKHGQQGSLTEAHRRECVELFLHFLPALIRHCQSADSGRHFYALFARCLCQRTRDYGLEYALGCIRILRHSFSLFACFLVGLNSFFWLCRRSMYKLIQRLPQRVRVLCLQRGEQLYSSLKKRGVLGTVRRLQTRRAEQKRQYAAIRASIALAAFSYPCTRPSVVILDHDAGGGACAYRQRRVTELLAEGSDVFVWQYLSKVHCFTLEFSSSETTILLRADTFGQAASFIRDISPQKVFHNELVGWPNLDTVFSLLSELQQRGTQICFFLHDYFALCPYYSLLNAEERFCGVPEKLSSCFACLPKRAVIPLYRDYNILTWRSLWETILCRADAVCVSDASVQALFSRVYPALAPKITVTPPPPLAAWQPLPPPPPEAPTVIGIIGTIARHKGAKIVEELVAANERSSHPVQIVVIGTLESSCRSAHLTVTGTYQHQELPNLIEQYQITVGLVPSPLPETFCFVAQEITLLGLPLVCLDLGAQGVRARNYPLGAVANTPDGAGCLKAVWDIEQRRRSTILCNVPSQ